MAVTTDVLVHRPVLVKEIVSHLITKADGVYVDGTVGAGGHAEVMLRQIGPKGKILGIDRDPEILEVVGRRLGGDSRIMLIQGHYEDFNKMTQSLGETEVDGILLDLGVSSLQFDRAERGFSFQKESFLDMRMNPAEEETAAEILAKSSVKELEQILRDYGEEPFARRIAIAIDRARGQKAIESTVELAEIVKRSVPPKMRYGRIHPATRTFQALRIAVNRELDRLDQFLTTVRHHLRPGGRVAIISYHSLEDRRVKQSFLQWEQAGLGRRITKKPIVPEEDEVLENPRARSAKLRVFEKQ